MSSNAERLGRYVKQRREDELWLSQIEVAQAGGPSNTKLTEVENGRLEELTPLMARKLDAGLRWEPGSARAVWEGGEPTPLERRSKPHDDMRAAIMQMDDLTDAQKRKLMAILDADEASTPRPQEGGGRDAAAN